MYRHRSRKIGIPKGLERLKKNLDGVEETHDQFLDEQVNINKIFDSIYNIKDN